MSQISDTDTFINKGTSMIITITGMSSFLFTHPSDVNIIGTQFCQLPQLFLQKKKKIQ